MAESAWHYGYVPYSFEYERRLRVGFVGCGTHSWRNVYPTFQYAPVDLVAVADPKEERAAAYANLDDTLDLMAWYEAYRQPEGQLIEIEQGERA